MEDVLTQFPFTKRVPFSPLPLSHHHLSLATTRKKDIIRISSEKDENVGSRPFRSDMTNHGDFDNIQINTRARKIALVQNNWCIILLKILVSSKPRITTFENHLIKYHSPPAPSGRMLNYME